MSEDKITLDDGKYEFTDRDYVLTCTRYGKEWRDFTGDHAVHFLFSYAIELRAQLEDVKKELDKKLLTAANPESGWQGINKECKLWQERAEQAEAENAALREKIKGIKNFCKKYKQWFIGYPKVIQKDTFHTDLYKAIKNAVGK
jgi:hypothetical protein